MTKTSTPHPDVERMMEALEAFVNAAPMEVRSLFIQATVGAKIPGISEALAGVQDQGAVLIASEAARASMRSTLGNLITVLDALRDPAESDPLKRAVSAASSIGGRPFDWGQIEEAARAVVEARIQRGQEGLQDGMRDVWSKAPPTPPRSTPRGPTKAS